MPLEHIERIEVMRGAHDAEIGNTLGGSVNIVTMTGSKDPITVLRASTGSNNTNNVQVGHRWSAGPVGWTLSSGFRESDGFIRNNDLSRWNFSGSFSLDLPDGGELLFSGRS